MRWFLCLWSVGLLCTQSWLLVESEVAPTIVDITKASEENKISLMCTKSNYNKTFTWKFKSSSTGKENVLKENNNTYMISSSSNTGVYLCEVVGSVVNTFNVLNFSAPLIPHTGRSIVLTQGDVDQTLECISYSNPTPELVWTVTYPDDPTPMPLTGSDSKTFSVSNTTKGISTLTISRVTFNERGTYNCAATSSSLNRTVTTSVLIRVHERLAPLWPFLGILCEVFIVACILIVVRRKSKSAKEELRKPFLDADYADSSQDEGTAGVRYRGGTRN